MATAVLTPQDCLRDPITNRGGLLSTPPRTKIRRNPAPTTPTLSSSAATKHSRGQSNSNRRKRSPNSSPPPRPASDSSSALSPQAAAAKILAMGPVKILKRGEEIQKIDKKIESPVEAGSSVKVDQKVEMKLDLAGSPPSTPKKPVIIRIGASPVLNNISVAGFYAGSGFFTSPPPSSLPVPVFLKKTCAAVGVDSEATNDLRRLLNLAL